MYFFYLIFIFIFIRTRINQIMDSRVHIWSIFKPHHFWSNSFWIYHHYYLSWLIYPEVLCFFNCDSFDVDYCTKQCHLAAISLLFIVISIHHKNQQLFTYHPQLSLVVFYEALIFCFLLILANKVFGTYLGPKGPQRFLIILIILLYVPHCMINFTRNEKNQYQF